jgi:hypothetical protein
MLIGRNKSLLLSPREDFDMKESAVLAAAMLLISATLASAQAEVNDVAAHPGEGDMQRIGAPWRYQHHYWGPGHVNPKQCWQWDVIDSRYEWECE